MFSSKSRQVLFTEQQSFNSAGHINSTTWSLLASSGSRDLKTAGSKLALGSEKIICAVFLHDCKSHQQFAQFCVFRQSNSSHICLLNCHSGPPFPFLRARQFPQTGQIWGKSPVPMPLMCSAWFLAVISVASSQLIQWPQNQDSAEKIS